MLRNLFANYRQRSTRTGNSECDRVRPQLLPYLDHELGSDERHRVEDHLVVCSACRTELAAFERVEAALGVAAAAIESPGDLRPGFYARLEQSRRKQAPIRWALAAPAVACLALALFVANHLTVEPGHDGRLRTDSTSPPAAITNAMPPHLPVSDSPSDLVTSKPADLKSAASEISNNRKQLAASGSTPRRRVQADILSRRNRVSRQAVAIAERPQPERKLIVAKRARLSDGIASVSAAPRATMSVIDAESLVPADRRGASYLEAETSQSRSAGHRGGVVLTSLAAETDLHVSDEDRNFMASTHILATAARRDIRDTLRIDDDNERSEESVELPALP